MGAGGEQVPRCSATCSSWRLAVDHGCSTCPSQRQPYAAESSNGRCQLNGQEQLVLVVHGGTKRIVDAILPAGAVRLKIGENVAVKFQGDEFLHPPQRRALGGWRGRDLLGRLEKCFG